MRIYNSHIIRDMKGGGGRGRGVKEGRGKRKGRGGGTCLTYLTVWVDGS